MVQNIFKGLGIALVTPFTSDGSVDYQSLSRLVEYQLKNGADFFCILATTGETPTLTAEEKKNIKELVVDLVGGKVPILIGCGGNNTADVVKELQTGDFSGIDGVLSVRWLSNDINNSITMNSTKIVDTWVGSSGKSIVSIYKVNIITNDEMKKTALLQEGNGNIVSGNYAHAEGRINIASGLISHAEGRSNITSGNNSHAEGCGNIASGNNSHAEGYYNEAPGYATHVQGKYNVVQSVTGPNYLGKYCHIVGNGTSDTARSNAHTLDWDGNAWFAGDVYTGGTAMDSGAKKLATEVPVSTADNGKVLSVVNGAWAAATMPSGVYVGNYTGDGTKSRTITLEFTPKVMFILIWIDSFAGIEVK